MDLIFKIGFAIFTIAVCIAQKEDPQPGIQGKCQLLHHKSV